MPRKAARRIGVALLGLAGVLVIVAAAGLGLRAYRQHLAAETLAIRSPNGVQEGAFVDIGGIKQWIQIRGEDRANPVLLFVHGGPGGSTLPISSGWRPWKSLSPSCNGTSAAPAGPMAPLKKMRSRRP